MAVSNAEHNLNTDVQKLKMIVLLAILVIYQISYT